MKFDGEDYVFGFTIIGRVGRTLFAWCINENNKIKAKINW